MSQNQEPPKPGDSGQELDPNLIKAIIVQQSQKLQLEADRLKLEEKRLDQNSELAKNLWVLNGQLMKEYPSQHRKTVATYGAIGIVVILIILFFLLYCINRGKIEFADKFLNFLGHIVGILGGFLAGRVSVKKKGNNQNTDIDESGDVEIIEKF